MTKKRKNQNGEGALFQRKDGRWVIQISLPGDSRKKRRRHVEYASTIQEAIAILDRVRANLDRSMEPERSNVTVAEMCERWITDGIPHLSHQTVVNYRSTLKNHILPTIGSIPVVDLSAQDLTALYLDRLDKGYKESTIKGMHRVISSFLSHAKRMALVSENVATIAFTPQLPPSGKRSLSPAQARKLAAVAESHPLGAAVIVGLATGMRSAEIRGLRWEDIDFNLKLVTVEKTLRRTAGEYAFGPTKTRTSRRVVPIPQRIKKLLRERQAIQLRESGDWNRFAQGPRNLVFTRPYGAPLSSGYLLNRVLRPLLREAKVDPTFTVHELRHTFASLSAQMVAAPDISVALGHSNVHTTLKTYTHGLPDSALRAVTGFQNVVWGDAA